jgi:hypothetical protein
VGSDNSATAVHSAIRCQGVRYVVVYKQEVGEVTRHRIDRLERDLFADVAPTYEDAIMRVYEVQNERPDQPYWTLAPREWYEPEELPELGTTSRWATDEDAGLLVYPCADTQGTPPAVRLQFDVFSYGEPRTLDVWLNGEPVGSIAVPLGWVRRVALVLPLHAGENRIEFRSRQPAVVPPTAIEEARADPQAAPRTISFNFSRVSVEYATPR